MDKVKALGAGVKTVGMHAAKHVSRNKAAYIAGGIGAAGIAGAAPDGYVFVIELNPNNRNGFMKKALWNWLKKDRSN